MHELYLIYPQPIGLIQPELYGHFSEHIGGVFYDGLWVGKNSSVPNIRGFRKDLVEKLKAIHPPVLRWPGGCFAELYHWRDGIGPDRPVRKNWWSNWDGRSETNEVGTHEFMDLCEIIGAKAYFAANITSTTPMDICQWMDYCRSPRGTTALALEREKNGHPEPFEVPFWGVGNENWGGGGNMTPQHYAQEFRRYASVMQAMDNTAEYIACGANGFDYDWTQGVVKDFAGSEKVMSGLSLHYYCGNAGDPVAYTEEEWNRLISQAQRMEELLLRHWNIVCGYGMQQHCKLVVDEWGCWHPEGSGPSRGHNLFEQQSTMRDAMVAALTLNIFNRHCDKIRMANVAQLVNNLHSLFLASGSDCIVTPTYHVFEMYQNHQGAQAIQTVITENAEQTSSVSVSASVKEGKTLVTLGNLSCTADAQLKLIGVGRELPENAEAVLLYCEDSHTHNTFEQPDAVQPIRFTVNLRQPVCVPKAGVLALHF